MRTQPRHSPCSRPGESQQETTQTQHSGWAAVPAWGAQPCALPQLAKGSLSAALSWLQHWHRDRRAVRPKVLSKEQTQAGGQLGNLPALLRKQLGREAEGQPQHFEPRVL